ncbi:MAG TPA: hypothetical protein VFD38_12000 [Myxococcaceae bacterium]|nr:hypothetical protein [Myxococcaceae bacterium]
MTNPEKRLQDLQARAINERIIEYGLRRGLLDALRLSYEPAKDGSLLIYVPRHRGHWRIHPPGVGEESGIRVIALGDDGRVQLGTITIPLRWDAAAADWMLFHASEPGEIDAQVWRVMALLARQAGWLVPAAA